MPPERNTRQGAAIRDVIATAAHPLLPQEILDAAKTDVPALSLATVYRNLKTLVADRTVAVVEVPGDPPRFEAAGREHHHHFQCRACGRLLDIPACLPCVSHLTPPGYEVDDHDLVLYGRCADCVTSSGRRGRASRSSGAPRRRG